MPDARARAERLLRQTGGSPQIEEVVAALDGHAAESVAAAHALLREARGAIVYGRAYAPRTAWTVQQMDAVLTSIDAALAAPEDTRRPEDR